MGIAKSISAIGEFGFYSDDYKIFASTIGQFFSANIKARFFDHLCEDEILKKNDEFIDLGKFITLPMTVSFCRYDESKPSYQNSYCTYEIEIPVQIKYKRNLTLAFIPNGIFELRGLPFSISWYGFIADILGSNDHYYASHKIYVHEILKVRNCYIDILSKINCSEVIIWTDAYYETEDRYIYDIRSNKIDRFQDIVKDIYQLDKITLFNFIGALKQDKGIMNGLQQSVSTNVAFWDKFSDKYEVASR